MASIDVLAVGAHPDDVEIGCGGAVILAVRAGLQVVVADLTIGEMGSRGSAEERERERQVAATRLGIDVRPCLHFPDTTVGSERSHLATVVALLRELRPRVVLAPFAEDRHPDHVATAQLVREACFVAGLAKGGEGDPHRPVGLFHYMLNHPFTPSFVIDITSSWSQKMDAVLAYASQFGPSPTRGPPPGGMLGLIEARSTVLGAMIGVERGEAFWCPGPVPLNSLPGIGGITTTEGRRYHNFL
jgi:bacillithiol biosynthesis deacetylase BshB1